MKREPAQVVGVTSFQQTWLRLLFLSHCLCLSPGQLNTWPQAANYSATSFSIQACEELSLALSRFAGSRGIFAAWIYSPSRLTSRKTQHRSPRFQHGVWLLCSLASNKAFKARTEAFLSENTDNVQQLAPHACEADGGQRDADKQKEKERLSWDAQCITYTLCCLH